MSETYVECPKCEFLAVKGCKFCPNCGEPLNTTPVSNAYQHPISAWFAALGLKPSCVVANLFVFLAASALAITIFLIVTRAFTSIFEPPPAPKLDRTIQQDYADAARRIPNLRYFPGWGRSDTYTLTFSKCTLLAVSFSGNNDSGSCTLRVYNHTGVSTDPHLEVTLYDRRGCALTSCSPIRYLWSDFASGETVEHSDTFLLGSMPFFYNVGEVR